MKIFRKYRVIKVLLLALIAVFTVNAKRISNYSENYSEDKSDVAIILGAGSSNGLVSPVFRERINQGIYLLNSGKVEKLLITGGMGEDETISDSEAGKYYAISCGLKEEDILIETSSRYTIENLSQSKEIMDIEGYSTALIVSDPLHMKRSMALAKNQGLNCKPSPTKTSMYRSSTSKAKSLAYETFYYTLGMFIGKG